MISHPKRKPPSRNIKEIFTQGNSIDGAILMSCCISKYRSLHRPHVLVEEVENFPDHLIAVSEGAVRGFD